MNEMERMLNSKGIRPTPMRLLIYKFLATQRSASTLNDIENAFEKVDRTTLYRTIKTFKEKGIVHQIDDGSGMTKYALCETGPNWEKNNDLHLHFYCINCKETICLTDYKIPQISLPNGYEAGDVNLVVKGICEKCSRRPK